MGKFVQNKSMDKLISIITYFDPNTDLVIKSIKGILTKCNSTCLFIGKVKDFTVLKIESGEISFPESFEIVTMTPDANKITFFIYN